MENRFHQVLFGKLEINVFTNSVQVKNLNGIFRDEFTIPFPQITHVSMDESNKNISIQTFSNQYTYHLGGLMTTKQLYTALSNVL
ncbi:MAG: hypothetical protein DWQ04_29590 [Chloroflexi bacterium]|nr:MAG: hypothetical protein DWQ04_29590 [Chloroflexota bacterium]